VENINSAVVMGDAVNHGGLISREDFNKAFHMHGLTNVEVMEAFSMADLNRDGMLNKPEWDGFFRFFVAPFQTMTKTWRATKTEMVLLLTEQWFKQL